jgi:Holliday junction resolvasome RuvABC endonuclease subunit
MPPVRVTGLDLSLTATGVAFDDGSTHCIRTKTADGDHRLTVIKRAVALVVGGPVLLCNPDAPAPTLVVIEDLPTHAMSAGITGMVHGVVRQMLDEAGVPYARVAPATLKKYATGAGNADKTGMAMAAFKRAGREFPGDKGGDQCDAWWLRAAGLDALGFPLFELPKAQREALTKVAWP